MQTTRWVLVLMILAGAMAAGVSMKKSLFLRTAKTGLFRGVYPPQGGGAVKTALCVLTMTYLIINQRSLK